jgi:pSer/pThr/pTyr-binding forkhead associated (FHA) protein
VSLEDACVSRRHARIVYDGCHFWLFDLGSSNLTMVNGQRVERHRLAPGDLVRVGGVELRFELGGVAA